MTGPAQADLAAGAGTALHRRILSERTAMLAHRGNDGGARSGLLPEHLLCETSGQLYGLLPALIEAVLPFGCHPVPLVDASAAGTMLGLFSRGGHLYSLLELARLVGPAPAAGAGAGSADASVTGGSMLLLRHPVRRVAVRVDRVIGLTPLRQAGLAADQRAVLPEPVPEAATGEPASGTAADQSLISLIAAGPLHAAIDRLDAPASSAAGRVPALGHAPPAASPTATSTPLPAAARA